MNYILTTFPIKDVEYRELDEKLGDLAHFIAHQLLRGNIKNNHTDEEEDIAQELRLSIVKAGSYYKRQTYLEDCMKKIREYAVGDQIEILDELEQLWNNRTKHGANKQTFGEAEEELLDKLLLDCVPAQYRPNKNKLLEINSRFLTYCKSITWNCKKALGKKISKEKGIRTNMVSLSEHEHLG